MTAATFTKGGAVTPPAGPVVAGAPVSGTIAYTWTPGTPAGPGGTPAAVPAKLEITATDLKDKDGHAVNLATMAIEDLASVLKADLEKKGFTNVKISLTGTSELTITATKGVIEYKDYVLNTSTGITAATTMTIKVNGKTVTTYVGATVQGVLGDYGTQWKKTGTWTEISTSGDTLVEGTDYTVGSQVKVTSATTATGKVGDKLTTSDLTGLGITDANSYVKVGTKYMKASELTFGDADIDIGAATNINLYTAKLNGTIVYGKTSEDIAKVGGFALVNGTTMKAQNDTKFSNTAVLEVEDGYYKLVVDSLGSTGSFTFAKADGSNAAKAEWSGNVRIDGADAYAKVGEKLEMTLTLTDFNVAAGADKTVKFTDNRSSSAAALEIKSYSVTSAPMANGFVPMTGGEGSFTKGQTYNGTITVEITVSSTVTGVKVALT